MMMMVMMMMLKYFREICYWLKGKQSHFRPGQALSVPGGLGSQILRQSSNESGKVVSSRHRPPLPSPPQRKYFWYSLEFESTPGPSCGRKLILVNFIKFSRSSQILQQQWTFYTNAYTYSLGFSQNICRSNR
jgi:hypothetical protein